MYLYSDPDDDIRHDKSAPGAYEWWYFDAYDPASEYGLVAIFYDGLLFSPDYHEAVRSGSEAQASQHPGFSLSIYHKHSTEFYALKSYGPVEAHFGDRSAPVAIGKNSVTAGIDGGITTYTVSIDETIPCGMTARGKLTFTGRTATSALGVGDPNAFHSWNLVLPHARACGDVSILQGRSTRHVATFDTFGYHDHNLGLRPLENDFTEWYWGRIHLGDHTLVWYVMNTEGKLDTQAWLVEPGARDFYQQVQITPSASTQRSYFGLNRIREWEVVLRGESYRIVAGWEWDDGPFYQRFRVDLTDPSYRVVAGSRPGIGEYIKPDRITSKWVRPLIKIRHHRAGEKGNWIQRSSRLSRITW